MCVTGARCGGIGRVCFKVSYVQKNIAAESRRSSTEVQFESNTRYWELHTSRCAPNHHASHSLVDPPEASSAHKPLGGLQASLDSVDWEEQQVDSSPSHPASLR